ncbi:hypothetical protein GOBAR_DD15324 [Gossypium barbadense]|nr:hypothetical protein GOBAR_DD15324 [Gossypium barbadense]
MEKEHKIFALTIIFFLTITPVYGQYYLETVMRAASLFQFDRLFAIDDLLILDPEPTSTLIGNAQVLYVSSSRDPVVFTSVMYADFAFTSGRFNGSSFSLFSRNLFLDNVRELAIVGGRGAFRMVCLGSQEGLL